MRKSGWIAVALGEVEDADVGDGFERRSMRQEEAIEMGRYEEIQLVLQEVAS